MFTPEMASEIAKSACVTWRAQPPSWMRFAELLKEAQKSGMSPISVAGGLSADGNCAARPGFLGPGSDRPPGRALIAPSAGSSGLPNVAARADVASVAPAAAPRAMMVRREISSMERSSFDLWGHAGGRKPADSASCRCIGATIMAGAEKELL